MRLAHFNVKFLTCYSVELKSNNSIKLKIIMENLNRSDFFGEQEEFSKKRPLAMEAYIENIPRKIHYNLRKAGLLKILQGNRVKSIF